MENGNVIKKLVTFDIDTVVTSKILNNVSQIYDQIGLFMCKNGFIHVEGSVYISREALKANSVNHLIELLYSHYPYMKKCVRDMIVADISSQHSLNHLTDYDGQPGKFAMENTYKTPNGPIPKDEFKNYVLHTSSTELQNRKKRGNKNKQIVR